VVLEGQIGVDGRNEEDSTESVENRGNLFDGWNLDKDALDFGG
jgi:hypothetical protein